MKTYEPVTTTVTKGVLQTITCDVCGSTHSVNPLFEDEQNTIDGAFDVQEFTSIRKYCGYGSVFGDEYEIEIDICQDCFKEKLGQWIRYVD